MIEPQLIYIQIQDKCLKLNKKYPEYYSYISRQSNSAFKICVCLNDFVTIVKDYNFDYEVKINIETISIKEVCDIFLNSLWGIFKDRDTLKITDNLSFSLLHYDMRAKWRVIKRWNMSPKEPLNKFLKIITESEHIIQKANIDAL